jgi:glycosyltransferase involved in cell wall biosynthesis
MISVYIITYNEEVLLPYTLKFYTERFPGCDITIYDNFSIDGTRAIAKKAGCKIIDFYTGGKLSDQAYLNIKNNCWKDSIHDWVLIIDCDEWLHIQIDHLYTTKASIIRTRFTNMVNMFDNFDIDKMNSGVIYYDFEGKNVLFNRKRIKEINYDYGCHNCYPVGDIIFSKERFLLLHYKYINVDYVVDRYREFGRRLSDNNKKLRLGYHYTFSTRKVRKQFMNHRNKAEKINFDQYYY